jgi:hypothetical protein
VGDPELEMPVPPKNKTKTSKQTKPNKTKDFNAKI